jgi:hypothetical protein
MNEELKSRLDRVRAEFNRLQDDVRLTSIEKQVGEMNGSLTALKTNLLALRTKGYVFSSYLERKIEVLQKKWTAIHKDVLEAIDEAVQEMTQEARRVERTVDQAGRGKESHIDRAEAAVETLSSKLKATSTAIKSRYSNVADTIAQTYEQLETVKWSFEQAEEACFQFLQGENLILAAEAEMPEDPDDKDAPEGVLYVTDRRVIFEQKQKVATKKFLFITTNSEMVQKVLFEAYINHIEDVVAEDKRKMLVMSKALLHLQLSPEAEHKAGLFELKGGASNEDWDQLISRVTSGDIERERLKTKDEPETKASVSASQPNLPTKCSTCGAPLPSALYRGQTDITCEYCGSTMRVS